jgi:hypothetical protein
MMNEAPPPLKTAAPRSDAPRFDESRLQLPNVSSSFFAPSSYQPTLEQLGRDEKRKRYMRRNVYAPTIIAAVIALALFALIIFLGFALRNNQGQAEAREFIAGMSGLIVILFSIPLIAALAVVSIGYVVYRYYVWEQRRRYPQTGPMANRGRVQTILWQTESFIETADRQVGRGSRAVTAPLIKLHTTETYWRTRVRSLRDLFLRRQPYGLDQDDTRHEDNQHPFSSAE